MSHFIWVTLLNFSWVSWVIEQAIATFKFWWKLFNLYTDISIISYIVIQIIPRFSFYATFIIIDLASTVTGITTCSLSSGYFLWTDIHDIFVIM